MVKKLVEAGADPAKADKSGNTPMHAAAGEGAVACIKFFVEKGVSGSAKNKEGYTPLVRTWGLDGVVLGTPGARRHSWRGVLAPFVE